MHISIEAASDEPGLVLGSGGAVGVSLTWQTRQNHSKELLPNIDRILKESGATKTDLSAVFVDIGPGGYAALRVGVSTAKALAHALAVPIAGIGRLELDAHLVRNDAGDRRIVAVHRAGRGDVAWAAYRSGIEDAAPRMSPPDALHAALQADDIVTGDIDDELHLRIREAGAAVATPSEHRVTALAMLGHLRLEAGRADDPTSIVPLYLRAPAIGPQKSA
ncbi:MAG: tRNA (adenosine(37)-N6)-threonylcarbamoyltransferase complex dimerization subunit type 1 TsaB [Dehalococcoidia bacterium]